MLETAQVLGLLWDLDFGLLLVNIFDKIHYLDFDEPDLTNLQVAACVGTFDLSKGRDDVNKMINLQLSCLMHISASSGPI